MDATTILLGIPAGLVATGAMTLIEIPMRMRYGLDGLIDWQHNQVVAARFTRRPVEASVLPGLGLHFLHGLFQGMFFVIVLLLLSIPGPAWLLGAGFGVFLFVLTLALFKPVTGRTIRSGPHATVAVGVCLATHLVYGIVLAILIFAL